VRFLCGGINMVGEGRGCDPDGKKKNGKKGGKGKKSGKSKKKK